MRYLFTTISCLSVVLIGFKTAFADEAGLTVSVDYVSEYVLRGVTLAGEAYQPAVEGTYGNFKAGVWASLAQGDEAEVFADEVDFYASLGWDLSETVSGEFGGVLYHFPQSGGVFDIGSDEAGTVEVYGALDFDILLSPSVAAYYDVHLDRATFELSASYGVSVLKDASLVVSADAGLVEASEGLNYQYGKITGTANYNVTDFASIYASANYGSSSRDTFADTNFEPLVPDTLSEPTDSSTWFKVGVSSTF